MTIGGPPRKVTLTKGAPKVSLIKSGGIGGIAKVKPQLVGAGACSTAAGRWWRVPDRDAPAPRAGFYVDNEERRGGASAPRGVDLDLGCLYELADGSKGVIQALGNAFGSLNSPPWIALDDDDRTGRVSGGENMSINLAQPGRLRRVLIFAMIYEGAANWAATFSPSIPGSMTSSSTKSGWLSRSADSAPSPSAASVTANPSASR